MNKVFGIGLPGTGNSRLQEALQLLGYKILRAPDEFISMQLKGQYNFPGQWDGIVSFGETTYPQLDHHYPNSKFILTVRDVEEWLADREKFKPRVSDFLVSTESDSSMSTIVTALM